VVDFIEYTKFPFMDFPVFNVADCSVVVAAATIGLLGLRGIGVDGRRLVDPRPTDQRPADAGQDR